MLAYHLPNLICVALGGVLTDRIGYNKASLIFSILVTFGTAVFASSKTLRMMLMGRLIFGIGTKSSNIFPQLPHNQNYTFFFFLYNAGSESLSVTQMLMAARVFSNVHGEEPSLALVLALNSCFSTFGVSELQIPLTFDSLLVNPSFPH